MSSNDINKEILAALDASKTTDICETRGAVEEGSVSVTINNRSSTINATALNSHTPGSGILLKKDNNYYVLGEAINDESGRNKNISLRRKRYLDTKRTPVVPIYKEIGAIPVSGPSFIEFYKPSQISTIGATAATINKTNWIVANTTGSAVLMASSANTGTVSLSFKSAFLWGCSSIVPKIFLYSNQLHAVSPVSNLESATYITGVNGSATLNKVLPITYNGNSVGEYNIQFLGTVTNGAVLYRANDNGSQLSDDMSPLDVIPIIQTPASNVYGHSIGIPPGNGTSLYPIGEWLHSMGMPWNFLEPTGSAQCICNANISGDFDFYPSDGGFTEIDLNLNTGNTDLRIVGDWTVNKTSTETRGPSVDFVTSTFHSLFSQGTLSSSARATWTAFDNTFCSLEQTYTETANCTQNCTTVDFGAATTGSLNFTFTSEKTSTYNFKIPIADNLEVRYLGDATTSITNTWSGSGNAAMVTGHDITQFMGTRPYRVPSIIQSILAIPSNWEFDNVLGDYVSRAFRFPSTGTLPGDSIRLIGLPSFGGVSFNIQSEYTSNIAGLTQSILYKGLQLVDNTNKIFPWFYRTANISSYSGVEPTITIFFTDNSFLNALEANGTGSYTATWGSAVGVPSVGGIPPDTEIKDLSPLTYSPRGTVTPVGESVLIYKTIPSSSTNECWRIKGTITSYNSASTIVTVSSSSIVEGTLPTGGSALIVSSSVQPSALIPRISVAHSMKLGVDYSQIAQFDDNSNPLRVTFNPEAIYKNGCPILIKNNKIYLRFTEWCPFTGYLDLLEVPITGNTFGQGKFIKVKLKSPRQNINGSYLARALYLE